LHKDVANRQLLHRRQYSMAAAPEMLKKQSDPAAAVPMRMQINS